MNPRRPERPVVLITGASAGIGTAMAREYARRQHDLVLVARRRDRLEALASELSQDHGAQCHVLDVDLASADAVATLVQGLDERQLSIDILVNNAGYGVPGALLSSDWKVHQDFLQVMVTAVAELSWRLAAGMKRRGYGRIVNVASLAGLLPGSGGHTLYGAAKAWMIRFSESLSFELAPHGVHVTAVCPGFTLTEFHDANQMRDTVSSLPKVMWMSAEAVARQAVEASERGRRMVVNGRINRAIGWVCRHLPRSWVYRLLQGQAHRFRDSD